MVKSQISRIKYCYLLYLLVWAKILMIASFCYPASFVIFCFLQLHLNFALLAPSNLIVPNNWAHPKSIRFHWFIFIWNKLRYAAMLHFTFHWLAHHPVSWTAPKKRLRFVSLTNRHNHGKVSVIQSHGFNFASTSARVGMQLTSCASQTLPQAALSTSTIPGTGGSLRIWPACEINGRFI